MTEISTEMVEAAALRKELMRLMREDFDPTPPGWEGREWDDNAEDVADKMLVVVSSTTSLAMSAVRAAKMLIDNINEFGQVTDPVFLDCAETSIKAALAVRESTHVWVPKVPSEAMLEAATIGERSEDQDAEIIVLWETMLSASGDSHERRKVQPVDGPSDGDRERAKIELRTGLREEDLP